jgi:hypothetical protein
MLANPAAKCNKKKTKIRKLNLSATAQRRMSKTYCSWSNKANTSMASSHCLASTNFLPCAYKGCDVRESITKASRVETDQTLNDD